MERNEEIEGLVKDLKRRREVKIWIVGNQWKARDMRDGWRGRGEC
jgi:hypothetical protein